MSTQHLTGRSKLLVVIIALLASTVAGNADQKANYGLITGSVTKLANPSAYQAYCENIGDAADEARDAIRMQYLTELETRIDKRITALEEVRKGVEKWMKRREEFIDSAQRNLVDIYSAMRPEAAAQQISILDDETAASILLKLKPRTASAILNEIPPAKAARLASVIAGAAKTQMTKDKS